ncbi:MAG TPA: phosphoglycolate phosphatase [Lachnospiraceae bacterium]|nr:phosphoglycolate phosphatase [Lachnospiraceae bacterium]
MGKLSDYKKRKDFLVCVDSDGCAMDTMDIKHIRCFGPCMVEEWGLSQWKDEILKRWNEINLYTMTRGINRFKGLSIALQEISEKYIPVEDLDILTEWVKNSKELSNDALQRTIDEKESICLKKALSWSKAVNSSINKLPEEEKVPFEGVKEALAYAHETADVAIVSSANLDAVLEEWERFGLIPYTDIVLAQDAGSKAFCIGELLKAGYEKNNVVMCGDAPGDLDAARKNGVFYYPILVRKEKESWTGFMDEGFSRLKAGTYKGEYQEKKIQEFLVNLGG